MEKIEIELSESKLNTLKSVEYLKINDLEFVSKNKCAQLCADFAIEHQKKSLRKTALIGLIIMFSSFIFAIIETLYFGSNWYPQSKNEVVCDYIALYTCGLGTSLFGFCIIKQFIIEVSENIKSA
jgi:hypothetical protein